MKFTDCLFSVTCQLFVDIHLVATFSNFLRCIPGDARLAKNVKNKVFSFDLISKDPSVISCDMSNVCAFFWALSWVIRFFYTFALIIKGFLAPILFSYDSISRVKTTKLRFLISKWNYGLNLSINYLQTPLGSSSVDVAVFCLSLMGTNFPSYLREAHRTLKPRSAAHYILLNFWFSCPTDILAPLIDCFP